jgi:hypothetical protein
MSTERGKLVATTTRAATAARATGTRFRRFSMVARSLGDRTEEVDEIDRSAVIDLVALVAAVRFAEAARPVGMRLVGAPLAGAVRLVAATLFRRPDVVLAGTDARFGDVLPVTRRERLGVVARPEGRDGELALVPFAVLDLAWSRPLTWPGSRSTEPRLP